MGWCARVILRVSERGVRESKVRGEEKYPMDNI